MINNRIRSNATENYFTSIGVLDGSRFVNPRKDNDNTSLTHAGDKKDILIPYNPPKDKDGDGNKIENPIDDVGIVTVPDDSTNNSNNTNPANSGSNNGNSNAGETKKNEQQQTPKKQKASFALPLIGLAIVGLILLTDR